jgi:hypothetical protein
VQRAGAHVSGPPRAGRRTSVPIRPTVWRPAVGRDLEGEQSPWKEGHVNRWQRRRMVRTRWWSKALESAAADRLRFAVSSRMTVGVSAASVAQGARETDAASAVDVRLELCFRVRSEASALQLGSPRPPLLR